MFLARLDKWLWKSNKKIPPDEQTSTLESTGSSIRVRDTGGAKKPLVFLCDPPVTVEAYDELIAALVPDYRVIVMELPGFGFSRLSDASALTFQGAVIAVESAIKGLKLKELVLLGPCICGFVAAEIASRNNIPLSGLVLMQTPDRANLISWLERLDPRGLLRIPVLGQLLVRINARKISRTWINYVSAREFECSGMVSASDRALVHGGGYPLASMLQLWVSGPKDAFLELPVIAIWGMQDRSHRYTSTKSSCNHAPDAEIIEFPDCGHFTELERPDAFASTIKPFVEECFSS